MQIDIVLACLLISLGALIAYVLDEQTGFTPRLARWLSGQTDRL
jgi:hypothetical protein